MTADNTLPAPFKYWVFISYSHRDEKMARWLHKSIENYQLPQDVAARSDSVLPEYLSPVFRDLDELPASADLGATINEALALSKNLIVICSPQSAQSKWVNAEVEAFKKLGREASIQCLIVDGEPNATDKTDIDDAEECFCPALRYQADDQGNLSKKRTEPNAADIRKGHDSRTVALLRIIAGQTGLGFNDLYRREERRKRRVLWWITGGLSVLTASFAILGWTAYQNYLLAEKQKNSLGVTLAASDFKEGVRLMQDNNPRQALAYLARAVRTNGDVASSTLAASLLITGQVPVRLEFLTSEADNAEFSPDEHWLAVASGNTARVWEIKTGTPLSPLLRHKNRISSMQFSPDGLWLATASWDKTARVWDAKTGKPVSPPLRHYVEVESIAFSPDGRRLLTAAWDGTVRVWSVQTGQPVSAPMPHDYTASGIQFSHDGQRVLTISENTAQVWDTVTGRPVCPPIKHAQNVDTALFSPDGYRVSTVSGGSVMRWYSRNGQPASSPVTFDDNVEIAALSPDGRLAATISGKMAQVWNATIGRPISPPIPHKESVLSVQFSPDERWLLTIAKDKSVQIWEVKSGLPVSSPLPHENFIHAASFSQSGRWMLTVSDRSARIWHSKVHPAAPIASDRQEKSKPDLFSPDKQRLVKISNNIAQVWETQTDKTVSIPIFHNDYISEAQFSPDGHWLATASWDKTARIWDAQTGRSISQPMQHDKLLYSARFSPDGRWLVTTAVDSARVWEAKTGLPVSVPMLRDNGIDAAYFSQDGHWVVIGGKQWEFPTLPQAGVDFASFLESIAGYRLNVSGGLEAMNDKSQVELRKLLAESKAIGAEARHFLEWLFADDQVRTVTPNGGRTVPEHIRQLINQGTVQSLSKALDASPNPSLALVKLAETDADDLRSPHWALLALRHGGVASHASAVRTLASLNQRGSLVGISLRSSHHEPLQKHYRRTPKEFDPPDMSELLRRALALMSGDGVHQDVKQGFALLDQAAKSGDVFARYQLARAISFGAGVSRDEVAACRQYLVLANSGLPQVQNSLGWCYSNAKWSSQPDYAQARLWYLKAANQRYASALSNLGSLYKNGQGVERDWKKARDYYRQAAEKGDSSGAFELAELIEQDQGGEPNSKEALVWYRKAAELGSDEGMLAVASRYEAGLGLPQSYEQAADWYRRAAAKGNALAQFKLGTLLLEGKISADETAAHWFRQAAAQGTKAGAFAMGLLYETGAEGVDRDVEQSKRYYKSMFRNPWYDVTDPLQVETVKRLESFYDAPLDGTTP